MNESNTTCTHCKCSYYTMPLTSSGLKLAPFRNSSHTVTLLVPMQCSKATIFSMSYCRKSVRTEGYQITWSNNPSNNGRTHIFFKPTWNILGCKTYLNTFEKWKVYWYYQMNGIKLGIKSERQLDTPGIWKQNHTLQRNSEVQEEISSQS